MNILFVDTGDKKLHFSPKKVDIHTERNNQFFATSLLFTPPNFPPAGFASPATPDAGKFGGCEVRGSCFNRCPLRGQLIKLTRLCVFAR